MDLLSEGEQWEALKAWLRSYAPALIGGLVAGFAIYFGWQWYQRSQENARQEAAAAYAQIIDAYARGDHVAGHARLEELKRDHARSVYLKAAQLAAAKVYVERNEMDQAAAALKAVAEGEEAEFAHIARLRLARVQIEQARYDDALATLDRQDVGAYAGEYAHVRGDALFRKGDIPGALREYRAARDELLRGQNLGAAAEAMALLDLKIRDLEESDAVDQAAAQAAEAASAAPAEEKK